MSKKTDPVERVFAGWIALATDEKQRFDALVCGYMRAGQQADQDPGKRRGRPPGSKNRPAASVGPSGTEPGAG